MMRDKGKSQNGIICSYISIDILEQYCTIEHSAVSITELSNMVVTNSVNIEHFIYDLCD